MKEYFLIKEEKWHRHHFPLFVGQFMCSDYTRFYIAHTHAYIVSAYGASAHTYARTYTAVGSLFLTEIKE